MVTEFQSKAEAYVHSGDFEKVAKMALKDIFGEPLSSSVIYHLGGTGAMTDPSEFEKKIRMIFGPGAEMILGYVVKKLENPRKRIVRSKK
ncbi:MAG: hypothetical protein QFX35_05460 [Candidatus Verstraetearchaeota archaeon]|nr:hypothetical protein [Candidatus Verstraetearchaeota archaeon]